MSPAESYKVLRAQKSTYFYEAEQRAEVPFLHHQLLECDCSGLEYTIPGHDITLRIPEGAVSEGELIHFEFSVTMYGPFKFPENTRPISPIIWLCLLEEDYELKKPYEVIIPHFLMPLTKEEFQYHQVHFTKAHHKDSTTGDKHMTYNFHPCDIQPQFFSIEHKNFAVLESKHCCFYCLAANHSRELIMDISYCLVTIESAPTEIHFLATYFLETCLKVRTVKITDNETYTPLTFPKHAEYEGAVFTRRGLPDISL